MWQGNNMLTLTSLDRGKAASTQGIESCKSAGSWSWWSKRTMYTHTGQTTDWQLDKIPLFCCYFLWSAITQSQISPPGAKSSSCDNVEVHGQTVLLLCVCIYQMKMILFSPCPPPETCQPMMVSKDLLPEDLELFTFLAWDHLGRHL
jgi:hypothetical protein